MSGSAPYRLMERTDSSEPYPQPSASGSGAGSSSSSSSRAPSFRQRRSYAIIDLSAPSSPDLASPSSPSAPDRAATPPPPLASQDGYLDSGDSGVPSLTADWTDSDITLRSEAPSYTSYKSDDPPGAYRYLHRGVSLPGSRRSSNYDAADERSSLLPKTIQDPSEGTSSGEGGRWYRGPLFMTGLKLALLFLAFTGVVVGTFYYGMPPVDPEDKGAMKLPRSFADLQALNALFQKYKTQYPLRILACGVVAYLFVQTFSLPGSMYISILFGAAYGMVEGLILSCLCDSVGSMLCYTLSALLAPPLLALPFYRARVETWRLKILGDPAKGDVATWDSIFAFLLVLRIAPFPPHWVANFVAPHLGIGPLLFWATCFIGIAPVSVIHVTIGASLDSMTSAADFHILSLRNILGLGAVVVAVLIPVGLKRVFRKDLGELGEAEASLEEAHVQDVVVDVPSVHHVLEVDEEGQARRYQAIDSGVVLAAPSIGEEALHPDPPPADRKGKARAMIIPHIIDEELPVADVVRVGEKRGLRSKGYGAIETLHGRDSGEQAVYVLYGQ